MTSPDWCCDNIVFMRPYYWSTDSSTSLELVLTRILSNGKVHACSWLTPLPRWRSKHSYCRSARSQWIGLLWNRNVQSNTNYKLEVCYPLQENWLDPRASACILNKVGRGKAKSSAHNILAKYILPWMNKCTLWKLVGSICCLEKRAIRTASRDAFTRRPHLKYPG